MFDATLPLAPLAATQGQAGGSVGVAGGNATVVGGEDDHSIFRKAELVESFEHNAHGIVHRFHHAGVNRAVLNLANGFGAIYQKALTLVRGLLGLVAVFFPQCGCGLDGRVHGVEGKVGEEGLVFVFLDEARSFLGEANGQGFASRAAGEFWVCIRGKKAARRASPPMAALVDLKAVVFGV